MNNQNHTGTLYSFRTANEDYWYHTTDFSLLKTIQQSGFLALGEKVILEDRSYTISAMVAQVFAAAGTNRVNEFHHGEVNPFSIQLFITVKPD